MYQDPTNSMFPPQMPQYGNNPYSTAPAPSPYPGTTPMAHGGRAEKAPKSAKGKYVMAHFNKRELPQLDILQGKATYIPGTDIRHYKNLEKRFDGDHDFNHHTTSYLQEFAKGGRVGPFREMANQMKRMGRHGDTEVALIGPKTREYLDHYAGGGNVNPHTGNPEYFNLGDVLGGIGTRISPYVQQAGNYLGQKFGKGATWGDSAVEMGTKAAPYIKAGGNFLGQFAEPIGDMIGARYGNPTLGSQIEQIGKSADEYLNPREEQMNIKNNPGMADRFMNSPLGKQAQSQININPHRFNPQRVSDSVASSYLSPSPRASMAANNQAQSPANGRKPLDPSQYQSYYHALGN